MINHNLSLLFSGGEQVSAFAGTVANDASAGTVAWGDPQNAQGNNTDFNIYAGAVIGSITTTNYLKFTNFGFNIPAGKIIKSINLSVWACRGNINNLAVISAIRLVKAGSVVGTNLNSGSVSLNNSGGSAPDSLSDFVQYSFSGFGGQSFSDSDVNNSGFGFVLQCGGAKLDLAFALKGSMTVIYE